ncbi:MAG TPA: GNAT family N-acetyltransferase [Candidatus Brocadiia bacterium]|nr:GNAT family N-acetyltransferase [Candidatus Brocadiia bacterium]
MEGPRRAKLSEYDQLIPTLNRCFRTEDTPPEDTMLPQYYHIYGNRREACHNAFVMVEAGRVCGVVGLFPIAIRTDEAVLKVGGIGGVCSIPEFRGRGLMSAQLNNIIQVMREEKYDVSVLGGDRYRYGNYGWENWGRNYNFNLSARRVTDKPTDGVKIRKLERGDGTLPKLKKAQAGLRCRAIRSHSYWTRLFERTVLQAWTATGPGGSFGYVIASRKGENRGIHEFAGDPARVDDIMLHLLRNEGCDSLSVSHPAWGSPYMPTLIRRSSGWSVSALGMLRVINFRAVIEKYLPVIERTAAEKGVKGKVSFTLKDTGDAFTLNVGKQCGISESKGGVALELDARESARLLFGMHPVEYALDVSAAPFLARIFPLPLWFSRTDSI